MYIARRRKKVLATFALADDDGNIVKQYEVDCDPDTRLIEYNKAKNRIIAAEQLIHAEPNTESYTKYGQAVVDMMGVFFGDKAVQEILEFYENNYTEMILELLPFITDEVEPLMRKTSEAQLAEIKKRKR